MTETSDTDRPAAESAALAPAAPGSDAPTGRLREILGPINRRDYRLFLLGASGIGVGVWVHLTTIGWLTLELTDSSFSVSLINVLWFVPFFVFALPSGVIADRFDKKKVLLTIHATAAVVMAVHAVLGFGDLVTFPILAMLTVVMGSTVALELPARQSFMATLVSPSELMNALALNATNGGLMRFLGPLLGGVLLDTLGAGGGFTLFAMAELFFVFSLLKIRGDEFPPAVARSTAAKPLEDLREGLAYVRRNRDAMALVSLAILSGTVGWMYIAMMPVIARETLGGGAVTLGLLGMAVGLGSVPGSLYLAVSRNFQNAGRSLVIWVVVWGLAVTGFAFSPWLLLSMPLLVIVGLAFTTQNILGPSLILGVVEPRYHGRVMGLLNLMWGANIFGTLVLGSVADTVGVNIAVGASGILIAASAIGMVLFHPKLLRL